MSTDTMLKPGEYIDDFYGFIKSDPMIPEEAWRVITRVAPASIHPSSGSPLRNMPYTNWDNTWKDGTGFVISDEIYGEGENRSRRTWVIVRDDNRAYWMKRDADA